MHKKIALVTGGANGIGEAIALMLLESGLNVIIVDKDVKKLEYLHEKHPDLNTVVCDLSQFESVKEMVAHLGEKSLKINYLINDAAIQYIEPIEELDFDHWDEVIGLNLKTPVYLMKTLGKTMGKGDQIINISSVHGVYPRLNKYAYDISKAGLNQATREIALAYAWKEVRVNAVMLGATKTPMNDMFQNEEELKQTVKKIPLGRVADTDDIVRFMHYLVFEDSYSTGSVFTIDGGRSLLI